MTQDGLASRFPVHVVRSLSVSLNAWRLKLQVDPWNLMGYSADKSWSFLELPLKKKNTMAKKKDSLPKVVDLFHLPAFHPLRFVQAAGRSLRFSTHQTGVFRCKKTLVSTKRSRLLEGRPIFNRIPIYIDSINQRVQPFQPSLCDR